MYLLIHIYQSLLKVTNYKKLNNFLIERFINNNVLSH
jgi:hypothetical protein